MKNKLLLTAATAAVLLFNTASGALAHVVVRPAEVGAAARTNFTVSVPTEEDNPTVGVRLILPEGLSSVRPNVKSGWSIELKKSGEGGEAKVTEIVWTGGSIPPEQRDEFVFGAQAPAQAGNLVWKAYQTYQDGDIIYWEADPQAVEDYSKNNPTSGTDDHNAPKPYSVTRVTDDLGTSDSDVITEAASKDNTNMWIAWGALALSAVSLGMTLRKGR
jgi:uncharacterized protein YcnI